MNNPKVTLISSFATDRLFDEKGILIREQEGGPAFFISNVLKQEGIPFKTVTSPKIIVDILLKNGDEFGKIGKQSSLEIDFANINTPYLLISPIINEFNLDGLDKYKGKVFLDAQGLTREPEEFGKKKNWQIEKALINSIFCLKVADYELPYVNKDLIEKQKEKILLLTRGSKGCEMYCFSESSFIRPRNVIKPPNTIGAGDTFFANFTAKYIATENAVSAAIFASQQTTNFLSSKVTL